MGCNCKFVTSLQTFAGGDAWWLVHVAGIGMYAQRCVKQLWMPEVAATVPQPEQKAFAREYAMP
jgi:hypothetical protein